MSTSAMDDPALRLSAAKQKCQILYSELHRKNLSIQDTTLKKASVDTQRIPPKSYLRQYNTLKGHRGKIAQVRWNSNSVNLVSACQDGFMIIWNAVSGLKLQAIPLESPWVLSCAYSQSGRFVASAGLDNRCTVYRVNTAHNNHGERTNSIELQDKGRRIPRAHAAYISACEFITDDQVLTASGDMTISLWDLEKDSRIRNFSGHCGDVLSLSISASERANPQTFLSSGADGCVKLWDLRVAKVQQSCQMSRQDVNCVTQLPNGYSFISGDDGGLCKMYDFRSLCELETYDLSSQFEPAAKSSNSSSPVSSQLSAQFDTPGVVSVQASNSGRILYACYAEYGCLAWDVLRNEIVESIGIGGGSHTSRISQVAISPDGQGLATASWDSTIKIWSV